MSIGEKEQKPETPSHLNTDQYLDKMADHEAKKKAVIVFALGRTYMLMQLLGLEQLGPFTRLDIRETAESMGADVKGNWKYIASKTDH